MADNFLFYKSWWDIIKRHIADESKQNEMLRAIVQYGIDGTREFPSEIMFLEQTYVQIDSAKSKHDKRVEAGRRGGKAGVGKAKARYGNKNASKTQPNENENENDNENVNENIILITDSSHTHLEDEMLESYEKSNRWEDIDFDD